MEKLLEKIISERNNKTVYRTGNLAIKVFNENYAKTDVLSEALCQSRAEEAGIKVPKVREVAVIDGRWAIISDFIEGENLQILMQKHPEKMSEYLSLFVDLQMDIHKKKSPKLIKLRDKMRDKITEAELPDDVKFELHARIEAMPKHTKVCHGDFCPSNIIITPNGEAYVLDWAHMTQGNASADVARTYLLFCLAGRRDIAEKYLDLFCSRSSTTRHYVVRWLPFVAGSQSVKGKEEEREFLLKWVTIAEYE